MGANVGMSHQRTLAVWGAVGQEGGWGFEPPFVASVTSYLVTFIRILQNL